MPPSGRHFSFAGSWMRNLSRACLLQDAACRRFAEFGGSVKRFLQWAIEIMGHRDALPGAIKLLKPRCNHCLFLDNAHFRERHGSLWYASRSARRTKSRSQILPSEPPQHHQYAGRCLSERTSRNSGTLSTRVGGAPWRTWREPRPLWMKSLSMQSAHLAFACRLC